jgi:hypothetical protein
MALCREVLEHLIGYGRRLSSLIASLDIVGGHFPLTLARFRCWHDRKKKPVFCEVDQFGYWFPFYLEHHGLQISRQYPLVPVIPSLQGIPGRPGKPLCPVNPRGPI